MLSCTTEIKLSLPGFTGEPEAEKDVRLSLSLMVLVFHFHHPDSSQLPGASLVERGKQRQRAGLFLGSPEILIRKGLLGARLLRDGVPGKRHSLYRVMAESALYRQRLEVIAVSVTLPEP